MDTEIQNNILYNYSKIYLDIILTKYAQDLCAQK